MPATRRGGGRGEGLRRRTATGGAAVGREAGGRARSEPAKALYRKLSPGPSRPAHEVAANQRTRISGAMIEAVARHGYGRVTVRDLVRLAGVSTHTFYEHFGGGKEECLLATYEQVMLRTAHRIARAQKGGGDLRSRLALAFQALATDVARRAAAARLALLEAPAALGPEALARARRVKQVFEAHVGEGLVSAAGGVAMPPLLVRGIVAGATGVVRAHLLDGREGDLPRLAEELVDWALCFCREEVAELRGLAPHSPLLAAPAGFGDRAGGSMEASEFEDERALMLATAMRLVAEEGYGQLTVARIRAATGVSRRSFDAHFAGVEDCFLAACELHGQRAFAEAARVAAGAGTWHDRVRLTLAALSGRVARQPSFARALTEVAAVGREGMQCRKRLVTAAADRLRATAPAGQRPGKLAAEASAAAVWALLEHHVATGRASSLRNAVPVLSVLAVAPGIGTRAAVEAIQEGGPSARAA